MHDFYKQLLPGIKLNPDNNVVHRLLTDFPVSTELFVHNIYIL